MLQNRAVCPVAISIESFGLGVSRLAIPYRIDIRRTPRQYKRIERSCLLLQFRFGQSQRNLLRFAAGALNGLEVIVQLLKVAREFFLPGAPRNPDARFALDFPDGLLFGGHGRRKILAFARKGGNHSESRASPSL